MRLINVDETKTNRTNCQKIAHFKTNNIPACEREKERKRKPEVKQCFNHVWTYLYGINASNGNQLPKNVDKTIDIEKPIDQMTTIWPNEKLFKRTRITSAVKSKVKKERKRGKTTTIAIIYWVVCVQLIFVIFMFFFSSFVSVHCCFRLMIVIWSINQAFVRHYSVVLFVSFLRKKTKLISF